MTIPMKHVINAIHTMDFISPLVNANPVIPSRALNINPNRFANTAGVSLEAAEEALRETGGDLAEAILKLNG